MASLGGLLVLLGIGSFILPLMGRQFTLMEWVDPFQPWAGVGVALIGIGLIGIATARKAAAPPATVAAPPGDTPSSS